MLSRWFVLAGLGIAATIACDDPSIPFAPSLDELPEFAGTPGVTLVAPLGQGSDGGAVLPATFRLRWEGVPADSGSAIAAYQLKAVALETLFESDLQILDRLLNPFLAPDNPNILIPADLVIELPDDHSEPPPLPDSTFFYENEFWPRAHDDTAFEFELPGGPYAIAVRAIDEDGRVTKDDLFAIARDGTSGNVLKADVDPSLYDAPRVTVNIGGLSFTYPPQSIGELQLPADATTISWEIDTAWYGREPGPVLCTGCSGWGDWRETTLQGGAGELHIFTLSVRDDRDDPEHEIFIAIEIYFIGYTFDKPALLIDDFRAVGLRDCDHDAIVRPMVEHAVAPQLGPGEELEFYNFFSTLSDCGEGSIPAEIQLTTLARYETVFWNVAPSGDTPSGISQVVPPLTGPVGPTQRYLESYVRAGGNLVIWGNRTIGELLGGFDPASPYVPILPPFPNGNFGTGSFVWDVMRLRVELDHTGRGTSPGLSLPCSGLVGLERASAGPAGLPAGVVDPTGYDPTRVALWTDIWTGALNPTGIGVTATTGRPPLNDPLIDAWYTVIPNSFAYEDPSDVCGTPLGSPLEGQSCVLAIAPEGTGGKIVWMGVALHEFAVANQPGIHDLMRAAADWVHE